MLVPRRWSALIVMATAIVLTHCGGRLDLAKVGDLPQPADPFAAGLYAEYLALAAAETAEGDWIDADYFLAKAAAAAAGDPVLPQALGERDVPASATADLLAARARLMQVIEKRGAERGPKPTAQAQAAFDCWLQEQEEDHQEVEIVVCREAFETAIAAAEKTLIGRNILVVLPDAAGRVGAVTFDDGSGVRVLDAALAALRFDATADTTEATLTETALSDQFGRAIESQPRPPQSFTLYFTKGRDRLTEASAENLKDVIADIRARGAPEVHLVGHSDSVGGERFNERLSKARVEAVSKALVAVGVEAAAVTATFQGEADPAVPTADEVAEPRNRRVEVQVR